jgi:mRNA interferase MazF
VRGDVYRLKRPRAAQGHEQQGERYAVVVQANAYEHLSTWLVAPTTTKSFGSMIHPTIELLGRDVRVLVEQTTAVDPQRLGDFAGRLDPDELMEINVALRAVLDLDLQAPAAATARRNSRILAHHLRRDQVIRTGGVGWIG